jgi:hypothetical protein
VIDQNPTDDLMNVKLMELKLAEETIVLQENPLQCRATLSTRILHDLQWGQTQTEQDEV